MRVHTLRSVFSAGLALACLSLGALGQANKASELQTSRNNYEQDLRKLQSDCASGMKAWPGLYTKELDVLQKSIQKAGDIEGWQAVSSEAARFAAERKVEARNVVSAPAALKALQTKFADIDNKLTREKNRQIAALTDKYLSYLNNAKRNLTVAGKMDQALAAKSEIERVSALPEVLAAQEAVASAQPAQSVPAPTPPPVEQSAPPPPPRPTESAPAEGGVKIGPSGEKIYEGMTPPPLSGVTFKNLPLSSTDRLRSGAKVSAIASLGKDTDVTKSRSGGGIYLVHEERSGTTHYQVRLSLRANGASTVVPNPKLVVQYFGRDPKTSGRITPKELATQTIPLPTLDGKRAVWVDCPRVSTSFFTSRYRDMYYGGISPTSASGTDLYGVVLSVFDGPGALVMQVASEDSLDKMGVGTLQSAPQPVQEEEPRRFKDDEQRRTMKRMKHE